MKPDLDDYEEMNDAPEAPRSRAMSWLVLTVAVGGFAALAYYAYHSGSQSAREGDMLVVQADTTPLKQAPADAGGEQFPNKDKTIYDVISPNGTASGAKVEKMLPDPEHPVVANGAKDPEDDGDEVDTVTPPTAATSGNTTTFVNKNLAGSSQGEDPVDVQSMKQGAPAKAPEAPAAAIAPLNKPVPPATTAAAATPAPLAPAPAVLTPAPAPKSADNTLGAPTLVNEKPAPKAVPAADATPTKAVPKPTAKTPKKIAPAASGGAYKVQLGAFKSEEEAQAQWKKITAKFSGTIGGAPIIVKADLPNGTFYRLRASGFASEDAAKAACASLSAKSQPCFPAGK
jgi:cell division septation protein DedD